MIRKAKCSVCGCRFKLERWKVYLVERPRTVLGQFTSPATTHSAADCPACGCQMLIGERLPAVSEGGGDDEGV